MDTLTIIGIIIGSGGIGGFLVSLITLPQKKRLEQLSVDQKAIDQWKELYERSEADGIRKSQLINKLYDDLKDARKNENNATTENAKLCILKCDKVDCIVRKPPLGYNSILTNHGDNTESKDSAS